MRLAPIHGLGRPRSLLPLLASSSSGLGSWVPNQPLVFDGRKEEFKVRAGSVPESVGEGGALPVEASCATSSTCAPRAGALRLYDEARAHSVPLSQHHYSVLLYLCSSPPSSSPVEAQEADLPPPSVETARVGVERGFEIFRQKGLDSVPPNEATFTSLARLAAAKEDPELAFQLIEQMSSTGIPPRLRSYGPALFGFCKKGDAERAYEVESHMVQSGVLPEEAELAALLQLSAKADRGGHVYRLMHRMR